MDLNQLKTGGDVSESLWNDEMIKPLKHIRVIDLSGMLSGPFLTRILAQYGAEIIKVEKSTDGDPLRSQSNPGIFELLNQGKKSLCTDFTNIQGREIIKNLVSEADVFVENFLAGTTENLGLGYADLAGLNSNLLYLSLRGVRSKPIENSIDDLGFLATSGVGDWFLKEGGLNHLDFGNMIGGVYAPLTKLLIHLANPQRRGMHLVSYAEEAFRSLYLTRVYEHHLRSTQTEKWRSPKSGFFECQEGRWIRFQAVEEKDWDSFCKVTKNETWGVRGEDMTLIPDMEKLFKGSPSSQWELLGSKYGLRICRVDTLDECFSNLETRALLTQDPLAWAGFISNKELESCPKLGQDSFSILHSLGYSNEKISRLMAEGVVIQQK